MMYPAYGATQAQLDAVVIGAHDPATIKPWQTFLWYQGFNLGCACANGKWTRETKDATRAYASQSGISDALGPNGGVRQKLLNYAEESGAYSQVTLFPVIPMLMLDPSTGENVTLGGSDETDLNNPDLRCYTPGKDANHNCRPAWATTRNVTFMGLGAVLVGWLALRGMRRR